MNSIAKLFHIMTFKTRYFPFLSTLNCFLKSLQGLNCKSSLPISTKFSWPHKVVIGKNTRLEQNIFFKYDGPYSNEKSIIVGDNVFIGSGCEFNIANYITIGSNSLIASGCKFIDHDHGINKNELMRIQKGKVKEIIIEEDVWIGANAIVLKGVKINKGAVIAAGAVVNQSIPEYEIWGGIPARKIGER